MATLKIQPQVLKPASFEMVNGQYVPAHARVGITTQADAVLPDGSVAASLRLKLKHDPLKEDDFTVASTAGRPDIQGGSAGGLYLRRRVDNVFSHADLAKALDKAGPGAKTVELPAHLDWEPHVTDGLPVMLRIPADDARVFERALKAAHPGIYGEE